MSKNNLQRAINKMKPSASPPVPPPVHPHACGDNVYKSDVKNLQMTLD